MSGGLTSGHITARGVSTLEILIAFAVLILCMTAVIQVAFGNQSVSVDTQTNTEALSRAGALLEQTRARAQQNFSGVVSQGSVTEQDGSVAYTKKLDVMDLNSFAKQATSTVTWQLAGRTMSIVLSSIFTDPIGSLGGSLCSPTVSGDWTAPQVYGYVDFSSSAGATGVSVRGTKAYVVSDPSSSGTDDFFIIDVSDPTQKPLPILSEFSTSYGLTDVRAVGNYAYVAADSAAFQLLVIDVSDPTTLNASKIKAKRDTTATGDTAVGNTLAYANKKIYLGLTKSSTGGPEFHIFDVSTPTNPVEVGPGYFVGAAVNHIEVKNNIAYLTTAADNEIIALDVSNPNSPTFVGAYSSAILTGQALALDTAGNLYFGRIGGTGNPKLLAFTVGDLSTPIWTMDMSKQSGVYTMLLRSNFLFMTTADPNDGLQVWDISAANATTPPTRHDTSPLNIQQGATSGADCVGNLLYVAQRSQRALQIVGPQIPSIFDYTLSAPASVTLTRAGASKTATISATLTSGTTQPINFTNSVFPTGVVYGYSATSCSPNCSTVLTMSAADNAVVGSQIVYINASSPPHTTSFTLTVDAPAFSYALSNSLPDISIIRGGAAVAQTIVVTMAAGAVPQLVTLTPPSPASAGDIIVTPSTASCTPSATSPYTCQVDFSYKASASATKKTYNNQVVVGAPNAIQSGKFKMTVN